MGDLISRQAAIDALEICDLNEDGKNCHKCPLRDERWDGAWETDETTCCKKLLRDSAKLLSAQPDVFDIIAHLKKRLYETAINNIGVKCDADNVFSDIAEKRLETWMNEICRLNSYAGTV